MEMETQTQQKQDRKKRGLVLLLLLLCLLGITGTMSWLTHSSKLDNTFTVGQISDIDPDGKAPTDPDNPSGPVNPEDAINKDNLTGNLYEPHFKQGMKLEPGVTIAKDPYVGIGKGSESSYVFVNVTSNMNNNKHIYFTLNDGWEAVDATPVFEGRYTSGLFMYTAGLDASKEDSKNVWTKKPIFYNVVVDDNAVSEDFQAVDGKEENFIPTITVQAYLHQKYSDSQKGDGNQEGLIKEEVAKQNAKDFFNNQKYENR